MTFQIEHVANCFLQRDFEDGYASITPMKLQKLIYILNGWHLAVTGGPVVREPFRAWQYGPVEPGLYRLLKHYGNKPISEYLTTYEDGESNAYVVAKGNTDFYELLNIVIKKYMALGALRLSALTHQPCTPWDNTTRGGAIDNADIMNHFRGLVTDDKRQRQTEFASGAG